MRSSFVVVATALALAVPATAHANDGEDVWRSSEDSEARAPLEGDLEPALGDLAERLSDPEFQAQAAGLAQILVGTLLDLEVGPMAEAIDKATGGRGPDIDPDARLRDIAPDAEDLPEEVGERVPEAMAAMGSMADGMQAMIPAIRDLAEQMRGAVEKARPAR